MSLLKVSATGRSPLKLERSTRSSEPIRFSSKVGAMVPSWGPIASRFITPSIRVRSSSLQSFLYSSTKSFLDLEPPVSVASALMACMIPRKSGWPSLFIALRIASRRDVVMNTSQTIDQ